MKRFKNILVIPADATPDDPALVRAATLAESNAARMTVAWPLEETHGTLSPDDADREIIQGIGKRLDESVAGFRERGLEIETTVLLGRPFIEIIRRTIVAKHDLVMKTARGRKLHRNLVFGTTALHLLRKCPCPVWIVDPASENRSGGVLAAIDPDTTEARVQALNQTILQLATSLAAAEKRDVHVLHAWNVPQEDLVRHSPWLRVSRTEADNYVTDIEGRHRERFEAAVAPFRDAAPDMKVHFVKGMAEEVIPDTARAHDIEVIVMATLAHSGIPGLFIGNIAEMIINQADRSVLAIKPDDFETPVAA